MSPNGGVFLPDALYPPFLSLSGLRGKAQGKKPVFHTVDDAASRDEITESNSNANLYCIIAWQSGLLGGHKDNSAWIKKEGLYSMRYPMITLVSGLVAMSLTPVAAESYKDVKVSPQNEVKMHFYDVSAASGEALQPSLLRSAPIATPGRRAIGKAIYQVSWQLDMSQQSDHCQLYGVKVITKIDVTMPNWLQLGSLSAETQSSWNSFLVAMQEYEGRHKTIVQDAAKQIGDGVAGLAVSDSCQALRTQADAIGYQTLDAARERALRYQSETGKGRLMGVSYPHL